MNLPIKIAIFGVIIISISYSIGFIKNKKLKRIAKIVWIALLILFFIWYSIDFWKPVEWSLEGVA